LISCQIRFARRDYASATVSFQAESNKGRLCVAFRWHHVDAITSRVHKACDCVSCYDDRSPTNFELQTATASQLTSHPKTFKMGSAAMTRMPCFSSSCRFATHQGDLGVGPLDLVDGVVLLSIARESLCENDSWSRIKGTSGKVLLQTAQQEPVRKRTVD
jgi:hypothetical protein